MNRYLRFLAFFGVPYGLLGGLMQSFFFRVDAFLYGALQGLLFAAFVVAVDLCMTRVARRRLERKGIAVTSMDPRQERHLQMSASPGATLEACVRVLSKMPKAKVVAIDSATGTVIAETSMSWRSFGERMTVEVQPDSGGSRLAITSVPLLAIALMDGGKGAENMGAFLRGL